MKRKPRLKQVVIIIGLVVLLALLLWVFRQERREAATERKPGQSVQTPPRLSVQNGQEVVTLDKEAQAASGIAVAPLKPVSHRKELRAYGTVLELQSLVDLRTTLINLRKTLIDLRSNHAAAKAQVEKTRASLDASGKQYERVKTLYEENQNVSAKTFQAAEAALRSDEASVQAAEAALSASQKSVEAAEEALQALEGSAVQQWGAVLMKWLFDNTLAFKRLARQQDLLIQITLPSGVPVVSAPRSVRVETASGTALSASFVSPSPRTDPRIQGMSYLYVTAAQVDFLPGMNVQAYLHYGPSTKGGLVPSSAIVWRQGKAWVYVQKDSDRFMRREVSPETPIKDGLFVREGLSIQDRIVVKGAQLLLSLEAGGGEREEGEKE